MEPNGTANRSAFYEADEATDKVGLLSDTNSESPLTYFDIESDGISSENKANNQDRNNGGSDGNIKDTDRPGSLVTRMISGGLSSVEAENKRFQREIQEAFLEQKWSNCCILLLLFVIFIWLLAFTIQINFTVHKMAVNLNKLQAIVDNKTTVSTTTTSTNSTLHQEGFQL